MDPIAELAIFPKKDPPEAGAPTGEATAVELAGATGVAGLAALVGADAGLAALDGTGVAGFATGAGDET